MKNSKWILGLTGALVSTIALYGCGGGDGDGNDIATPQTAIGVFKDSNVAGLSYTSGGQSGVTGADGSFTYEIGEEVTFKVGAVTLGTTAGKALVTPIDLVASGNLNSIEVQNRVRFLMMLDADGDPLNGITIPESIRTRANSWAQVDFSTADLPAALATIIADAQSATGGTHTLPTATAAVNHLTASFRCAYSGGFKGTYSGDDQGRFGLLVVPNGYSLGIGYSTVENAWFAAGGPESTPLSVDGNSAFIAGTTSSGASFSGHFTSPDELSGSWQNETDDGTFSGSRVGGVANAQYRFTGVYVESNGEDIGFFTFDIDGSDQVTGKAYSIVGDELIDLTGKVSDNTVLTGVTSTGVAFNATLNKTTGALTEGAYNGSDGVGNFVGAGCRLN